jgi:murein biosynthesis integral membrane protein MurJ
MLKDIRQKLAANPIARSSLLIGVVTAGGRLLGYAEKLILAYFFGTGATVDVYNIILTLVLSVFLFFREITEPAFLPRFLLAVNREERGQAWGLFGWFGRWILLGTLALTVVICLRPLAAIHLLAPGLDTARAQVAAKLIRLAFPACIFLSLGALTSVALNALKRFVWPAAAELVFKTIIVVVLLVCGRLWGIYAVAAGVVAAATAKLVFQAVVLLKKYPLPAVVKRPAGMKETWRLSWPLLVGVSFAQVSSLVDNLFASYLPEGGIAALGYAKKVVELPVLIFPYILSTVLFPYFSELAISKRKQQLDGMFSKNITLILLVFLPLSGFFFVFAPDIVAVFFRRGAFNDYSTALTGDALMVYSVGMVFFAMETILVVFYFAQEDTRTPIFTGIGCVLLNMSLTWFLVGRLGYLGVAMAFVVSKSVKVLLLLFLLRGKMTVDYAAAGLQVAKLFLATGATVTLLAGAREMLPPRFSHSPVIQAATLAGCALLGAATYVLALGLLKFRKTSFYLNLKFDP